MSYGYGGGRQNPYDQRGPGASQGGYGGPSYGGRQQYNSSPAIGRDEFTGQNVEMEPLTGGANHSPERQDPNAILNELRQIDQGIDSVDLQVLQSLQQRALDDPDSSPQSQANRELDRFSSEAMAIYRNFAGRIKAIKQQPESGSPRNAPQLGKVDRKLKDAVKTYQGMDVAFTRKLKDQIARQYRIVRPDASEAEVRAAVEDSSNNQVFSQALLQSDRRGQSRSALSAVQSRHEEIKKVERQMEELAQLFQDMEALVVQQESAVVNIEMKGEEVVEHMDKGTQEIGVAIKSARNARKWKWWCLGICVLIVIIIVVVILIYKFVIQNNGTTKPAKRWVLPSSVDLPAVRSVDSAEKMLIPGLEWTPESKLVIPDKPCTGDDNIVVPGVEWTPQTSGKWVKFAA